MPCYKPMTPTLKMVFVMIKIDWARRYEYITRPKIIFVVSGFLCDSYSLLQPTITLLYVCKKSWCNKLDLQQEIKNGICNHRRNYTIFKSYHFELKCDFEAIENRADHDEKFNKSTNKQKSIHFDIALIN